jgi:hypothetical protein
MYRITVAMKVETDIIPSESDTTTCDTNDNALFPVSLIGGAVTVMIMYVQTFKTSFIIGN